MTTFATPGPFTPILTKGWDEERSWALDSCLSREGCEGLKRMNTIGAVGIANAVKASGLRGRGGAGFPTGLKWFLLPSDDGRARYLVVNTGESEPGTCKDIPTIMVNPHVLIEGIAITPRAINCCHALIYLRGEVIHVHRRLLNVIKEVKEAGILPDLEIVAHAGAGAYTCGEGSALLDSFKGRRGHSCIKPPFPTVAGLYARLMVVNNVESIAQAIGIFRNSPEQYSSMGTERSKGHGIFSPSGHAKNPGQFEAPFGTIMRELIDMTGGIREGHTLKLWTPGGSSTPIFTEAELDIPLDYESVGAADSVLGTRALQVFDETVSVARAVTRWVEFYQHESCGRCTPYREGTYWIKQIMYCLEKGQGLSGDVDLLGEIAHNIVGCSFCPLGDTAATPITLGIKKFCEEFEAGLNTAARELFSYEAFAVYA